MKLKIFWFREDLRLEDNRGLFEFTNSLNPNERFLFLYIKNENSFNFFGAKRIRFLYESLDELKKSLNNLGFDLFITKGKSTEVIKKISEEFEEVINYANEQPEIYSRNREEKVKKISNVQLNLYTDSTIFGFNEVLKDDGKPYTVYTPFSKKFFVLLNNDRYKNFKADLSKLHTEKEFKPKKILVFDISGGLNEIDDIGVIKGGRSEGIKLLKKFYDGGISSYKKFRDFPATKGTSYLSPFLHFGIIGIRECFRTAYSKLNKSQESESQEILTWIKELIWREFYYNISYHFSYTDKFSFKKEYDKLNWRYDEDSFRKWCDGKTGYPIVDAGMRQLKKEGWMHNRVRMIVAMFLTKDLFIDWRWGEKYFAEHLIDMDFSSNNGGWQWSASTGCDAQPYFRIFNPVLQSKKFDTEGDYIKKYVPELQYLPSKFIHTPWEMTSEEQEMYKMRINIDYPEPIVNHQDVKNLILSEFKKISAN